MDLKYSLNIERKQFVIKIYFEETLLLCDLKRPEAFVSIVYCRVNYFCGLRQKSIKLLLCRFEATLDFDLICFPSYRYFIFTLQQRIQQNGMVWFDITLIDELQNYKMIDRWSLGLDNNFNFTIAKSYFALGIYLLYSHVLLWMLKKIIK